MNLHEKYQEQSAYEMGFNSGVNYELLANKEDYNLYVGDSHHYEDYKNGWLAGNKQANE